MGALTAFSSSASAQEIISSSSDVTVSLGNGAVASDEDVFIDNQLGIRLLENLGAPSNASAVTAYGLGPNKFRYVSFETTTLLPGGAVARPGDVALSKDGGNYALIFDASAEGLPETVQTDAFSTSGSTNLFVLSFDTTVELDAGLVAADEDLVSWSALGGFQLVLDGSTAGIPGELDIDAVQDLGRDTYLISFDTSGIVGGVTFDDEDVLRLDGSSWSLEIDGSAVGPIAGAADLDAFAVPEPSHAALLYFGSAAIIGLGRRRLRGGPRRSGSAD
ncbi:MAG: hypothetical protein AB8G23_02265 [Myxococcota bacterium]